MALVIQPGGSIEASGKFAGMVYSRNRAGQIVRGYRIPVQPRSPRVTQIRYDFQSMNRRWQDATQATRDAFNTFGDTWTVPGRLGNTIRLTGQNWFIGLNTRLSTASFPLLTAPPLNPQSEYTPILSFSQTAPAAAVHMAADIAPGTNQAIWLYRSIAMPGSSNFQKPSLRLVDIFTAASTTPYIALPAADIPTGGARFQFEAFAMDAFGRITPKIRVNFDAK